MIIALAFAAASTLATQGIRPTPACPGHNTREVNRCLNERLARADDDLGRYVTAARRRLTQEAAEGSAGPATERDPLRRFAASEKAWSAYREAECGAVYDYWADGTIRTAKDLACRIRLTRLHAHTVWQEWLTFADNTPPLLAEPPVAPD
jgi:uncharacterized protein YecT (DUF1311 family)